MPPFGRLAALIVSGPSEAQVRETARDLGASAPHGAGMRVLGPASAPLAMLRSRHRQRLLLKTTWAINIQAVVRKWLERVKVPNAVRVRVDIDPYTFL
jgi:primosomal protein N' (replication factor Y)